MSKFKRMLQHNSKRVSFGYSAMATLLDLPSSYKEEDPQLEARRIFFFLLPLIYLVLADALHRATFSYHLK